MSNKTYLMHHGIKGQKWGVENGPPYPLNDNVKAIAYRGGVLKDGTKLNVTKSDVAKARQIVNKNMKYMSTQDLNEYRNRLMLEGNLADITGSNWSKKQGKKVLDSLEKIATGTAIGVGTKFLTNAGMFGIAKFLGATGAKADTVKFLTKFEDKDDSDDNSDLFGRFSKDDESAYDSGLMDLVGDIFK